MTAPPNDDKHHRTSFGLVLAFLLLIVGCQPTMQSRPGMNREPSTLPPLMISAEAPLPNADPWLSLTGRSDFNESDLDDEQQMWFRRLWHAIDASRGDMLERARGDDAYDFARWLFQYNGALLVGLRTSGDLRFLDEVDRIAEAMRANLRDGWCGGVRTSVEVNVRYGTVVVPDGFLNFRRRGDHRLHHCRDTSDLEEGLVHGHLAMVMYAYHANRHLVSPSGIDYGERADFWFEYLRDHFEAKWRQRSATTWPAMDFIDVKFCHTYLQMSLYYYFMGKRLLSEGSSDADPYLRHALRMSQGMFVVPYVPGEQPGGFVEVDTPLGDAVVYSFGAPGRVTTNAVHLEACPMTYARYMLTSILALRFESFGPWDDDIMTKLANGVSYFLIDTDVITDRSEPFSAGVTGRRSAGGIPPTERSGRNSAHDYSLSPLAAFAAWESSGRIDDITRQVYSLVESDEERPSRVLIPAAMLLRATLDAEDEGADGRP